MHKANIDKKISLSDLNRPKDFRQNPRPRGSPPVYDENQRRERLGRLNPNGNLKGKIKSKFKYELRRREQKTK